MNFYRNRAINPAARSGKSIADMRDAQPMPPTSRQPVATITVKPPKVKLAPAANVVITEFDRDTDGLGTYIINNAKAPHVPILNGASSSAEGFNNLLLSLRGEYEAARKEEDEEAKGGAKEEDKKGAGNAQGQGGGQAGSGQGDQAQTGNNQGTQPTGQPTYHAGVAETLLRGWVGSVTRLLREAQTISQYNFTTHGAEYCLLHDDIYAVRDILKAMVNTARAINRKEGKVFSIERRPVGKMRLDRNVITCYLLTIKTVIPQDGKVTVEYAEDRRNGVVFTFALMRNGYRWLVLPVNNVAGVVNELNPISYSHRVGKRTTRIIFGSLFGHGMISQVFNTASQSQLHYNQLHKIRF